MSTDYTIIQSSPIHVGNEPDYFSSAGFGGDAEFHFQNYGGFQPSSDVYISRPDRLPALDRYAYL
jgi:hypothetical protein